MAELTVVGGDYEEAAESLGEAIELLGQMKIEDLAGRVVAALPSSVGGGEFAGARGKLTRERDELATVLGQVRGGVLGASVSFAQTEEELEQLSQGGLNLLAGARAEVA
ncbi:hypothetical protein [Buchananella hordeovulneris]|uniref:hypothetical protein n=1 Tax=Buchananella hordeovulneris TaxID=52770 RepID=UPI000F5EA32A|nr:hypothetical protein [Buchananella hordeovulneris]RRD41746.1 hypothetical protein EII13_10840 [Buchananella hordeovulneris]